MAILQLMTLFFSSLSSLALKLLLNTHILLITRSCLSVA